MGLKRTNLFIFFLLFVTFTVSVTAQEPIQNPQNGISSTRPHLFQPETTIEQKQSKQELNEEPKLFFSVGVQKLLFSLAAVTLLFLILLLILKKFTPGGIPELPREVFEVLGKTTFTPRQKLYILRCGQKLFLVSVSQNGLDRIGEITDSAEVERLTRRCHGEILGTTMPAELPTPVEHSGKEA